VVISDIVNKWSREKFSDVITKGNVRGVIGPEKHYAYCEAFTIPAFQLSHQMENLPIFSVWDKTRSTENKSESLG
jgi:hypothetical protein